MEARQGGEEERERREELLRDSVLFFNARAEYSRAFGPCCVLCDAEGVRLHAELIAHWGGGLLAVGQQC